MHDVLIKISPRFDKEALINCAKELNLDMGKFIRAIDNYEGASIKRIFGQSEAKKGLKIFTGKGKYIDCHYGHYLSNQKFYALMVPENPKYANEDKFIVTRRYVAKINKYPDYIMVYSRTLMKL